jgi:hypothetical protein
LRSGHVSGAPGPIAGAGLPILAIGYGVYWLIKRRRSESTTSRGLPKIAMPRQMRAGSEYALISGWSIIPSARNSRELLLLVGVENKARRFTLAEPFVSPDF